MQPAATPETLCYPALGSVAVRPRERMAVTETKPDVIRASLPEGGAGQLKHLGGSANDDFNRTIFNQTWQSVWFGHSIEKLRKEQLQAAFGALIGVAPRDELEGMLAAQLFACHNAAMECYRRAMIPEQTFEGRSENLNQASKLSRTYGALLEGLNRHRGKGQQKVTVEHVHVHQGGQAIVGNVEASQGVGGTSRNEERADAKQLAHAPEPPLRSKDQDRQAMPVTGRAR